MSSSAVLTPSMGGASDARREASQHELRLGALQLRALALAAKSHAAVEMEVDPAEGEAPVGWAS